LNGLEIFIDSFFAKEMTDCWFFLGKELILLALNSLRNCSKSCFGEPDKSVFSSIQSETNKDIHRGSEKLKKMLLKMTVKGRDFEQDLRASYHSRYRFLTLIFWQN
jgi:hypothetical protein